MSKRRVILGLLLVLVVFAGCRRGETGIALIAAFSTDSRVGRLTATWSKTPAAGSGERAEERIDYRVDVRNQLAEPLFVRLRDLRLLDGSAVVGRAAEQVACVAPPGETAGVLRGTVLTAGTPDGFEVEHFAVPLSERGRSFYREFLLRQRPAAAAAIDAEIAAFAAAPRCGG
jgi:hypothetical protein